jgi:hypothetical protein
MKYFNEIYTFLKDQKDICKYITKSFKTTKIFDESLIKLYEDDDRNEIYAFSEKLGYISFPEDFNIDEFRNFISLQIESIKKKIKKSKNKKKKKLFFTTFLVNYLLFIDRLNKQEHQQILESDLFKNLNDKEILKLIKLFTVWLNKEFLKNYSIFKYPTNVGEWQTLIIQISYVSFFDDPLNILTTLLYYKPSFTKEVLVLSNELVKARIVSYKNELLLNKSDLIELINFNESNKSFVCSMIVGQNYNPIDYNLIDLELWQKVLNTWDNNYIGILHNLFGDRTINDKNRMEYLKNLTLEVLDAQFTEKNVKDIIKPVNKLIWPIDFVPFSNLFSLTKIDTLNEIVIYDQYVKKFQEYLQNIKKDEIKLILDSQYKFKNDFYNAYNAHYCLAYTFFSCLSCSQETWCSFIKDLEKILYKLKVLYYGSFSSYIVAKSITENMLLLLLSISNINYKYDNENKNRIKKFVEILIKTVLFAYIKKTEKEDIIWDQSSYQSKGKIDHKIFLINEQLKIINEKKEIKNLVSNLFNFWNEQSTTIWPWMRDGS